MTSPRVLGIRDVARLCHELNRAYCERLGDYTQQPWDACPDWQKDSAVAGVNAAVEGATAEQLHQSWLDHKASEGWVYGEVKDPEAKTHPCMVPYAELPREQQVKDHLFRAAVQAMKPFLL